MKNIFKLNILKDKSLVEVYTDIEDCKAFA